MASKLCKEFLDILGKRYTIDEITNVTPRILDLASRRLLEQRNNPLYLIGERIRHFFRTKQIPGDVGYDFDEFHFPSPVVTHEDNFDSLLIPKNHVSRKSSDSYYVNSKFMFRSHTSAHQMHCLSQGGRAFISLADCYRRDEIDRNHYPVFHQCEIFKVYNHKEALGSRAKANLLYDDTRQETKTKQAIYSGEASAFVEKKMKTSIEHFVQVFFDDPSLKTRWVDAYFPFTHPSFELEILWRDKWMELLGCGVVRDEILKAAGIRDHVGFAAGFGLERFAMLKYDIPDIRLFWSNDTGILHQFENKSPFDVIKYEPISRYPQSPRDLSFWLPTGGTAEYSSNDFYDLCRTVGGDLIEQVKLVDEFTHPKTKKSSHCYRIVYRAADRTLPREEVNQIHDEIAQITRKQFNVELRQ